MRFYILLAFTIFFSSTSSGQYYYYDILNNQKLNEEYKQTVSSGFQRVVTESFESDNSPSEGFFCEKRFNPGYAESLLVTQSNSTDQSKLQTFYQNNRVAKTISTTASSTNTTSFGYNTAGQLQLISSVTEGNDGSATFSEEKSYTYSDDGTLCLLKISRNNHPVATIAFKSDSAGNIIEENPVEGAGERKYYYYYDEQNRLTDVVHFNERVQKLLPDFIFVYDNSGKVIQMTAVAENDKDYSIWRFSYTTGGLPEIQKCFSKNKKLLGTIQFEYFQ